VNIWPAMTRFSSTSRAPNTTVFWNERSMRPSRAMRLSAHPVMSWPSSFTVPAFGLVRPVAQSKNVDLPDPFGPISPQISPRLMCRLTSSTARTAP
jgi:hypothetical protein